MALCGGIYLTKRIIYGTYFDGEGKVVDLGHPDVYLLNCWEDAMTWGCCMSRTSASVGEKLSA